MTGGDIRVEDRGTDRLYLYADGELIGVVNKDEESEDYA